MAVNKVNAHRNDEDGQNPHDYVQEQEQQQDQEHQYPLARQSSVLSLTLDEFQSTLCGPGKTFSSMNMDEFLNNIWTAEEGNAMGGPADAGGPNHASNCNVGPPLYRQGSVTLPAPLSRKTVDEVWSEIHRDQEETRQPMHPHENNGDGTTRQATLGEMTLEDFLVKAGVVREGEYGTRNHLDEQQPGHRGLSKYDPMETERSGYGHMMGLGYDRQNPAVLPSHGVYHQVHHPPNFHHPVLDGSCDGGGLGYGVGRMGNGYASQQVGLGSPASPVSSDGLGGGQMDNPGAQWRLDVGVGGGRKRTLEGPVERVAERRQRRMIKNRESAARSRARKQRNDTAASPSAYCKMSLHHRKAGSLDSRFRSNEGVSGRSGRGRFIQKQRCYLSEYEQHKAYTVELEAELNQLKEENARLEEEQRNLMAKRKQMLLQSMAEQVQRSGMRMKAKTQRRCNSCHW